MFYQKTLKYYEFGLYVAIDKKPPFSYVIIILKKAVTKFEKQNTSYTCLKMTTGVSYPTEIVDQKCCLLL